MLHDVGSGVRQPLEMAVLGTVPYTGMTSDGLCGFFTPATLAGLGANVVATTNVWSIEAWSWPFVFDAGDDQVVALGAVGGANPVLGFRWNVAGTMQGFIGGVVAVTSPLAYAARAWHHIVLTYNHIALSMYVDGALTNAAAVVTATTQNNSVYLDQNSVGTARGIMAIEDVAVYGVALTAAQVLAHFNAADLVGSLPVYAAGGVAFAYPGVSNIPAPSNLDLILSSVRRVFPVT